MLYNKWILNIEKNNQLNKNFYKQYLNGKILYIIPFIFYNLYNI